MIARLKQLFTYYRKNFHQEAELLGKLNHRNIVKVLEMFDENNTTYYVMEHINGESLDDYIKKRGRIPEQEAIEAFIDIGTALQHMHVGDYWRVYVPYQLGYKGVAQTGIPAYSTLIFDIYLCEYFHDTDSVIYWNAKETPSFEE